MFLPPAGSAIPATHMDWEMGRRDGDTPSIGLPQPPVRTQDLAAGFEQPVEDQRHVQAEQHPPPPNSQEFNGYLGADARLGVAAVTTVPPKLRDE